MNEMPALNKFLSKVFSDTNNVGPEDFFKKVKNQNEENMKKVKGFKANQMQMARKEGMSKDSAGAILASATRNASPAAKKANPALKRVK